MSHLRRLFPGTKRLDAVETLRTRVERFRDLVERNNRVLELMADAEEKLSGEYLFDTQYLRWLDGELAGAVHGVVQDLLEITRGNYTALEAAFQRIRARKGSSVALCRHESGNPVNTPSGSLLP